MTKFISVARSKEIEVLYDPEKKHYLFSGEIVLYPIHAMRFRDKVEAIKVAQVLRRRYTL